MQVSMRSPEARIADFLQRVDQVGEVLGINVPQIVGCNTCANFHLERWVEHWQTF